MNDVLLQELIDFMRSRYFGKYRGVVIDVDAATMRVKASVPSVLGGSRVAGLLPCVPYAGPRVEFMMLPEIGGGVWIEFEGGDVSFPIWAGCYWNNGDIPSSAASTLKAIVTAAGTLGFDTSANSVTVQDATQNTVVIDSSGVTTTAGSGSVAVAASGVSVNNGALEVM